MTVTVLVLQAASLVGTGEQSSASFEMDLLLASRKILLVEGSRTPSTRVLVKNNNKMAVCRYHVSSSL